MLKKNAALAGSKKAVARKRRPLPTDQKSQRILKDIEALLLKVLAANKGLLKSQKDWGHSITAKATEKEIAETEAELKWIRSNLSKRSGAKNRKQAK